MLLGGARRCVTAVTGADHFCLPENSSTRPSLIQSILFLFAYLPHPELQSDLQQSRLLPKICQAWLRDVVRRHSLGASSGPWSLALVLDDIDMDEARRSEEIQQLSKRHTHPSSLPSATEHVSRPYRFLVPGQMTRIEVQAP